MHNTRHMTSATRTYLFTATPLKSPVHVGPLAEATTETPEGDLQAHEWHCLLIRSEKGTQVKVQEPGC